MTVISVNSGKVLEVAILFESCKGCTSMKKIVLSDPARYEPWNSYHIIVILIIMALSPEWKQQELLRYLVHRKRSVGYVTPLFMEMVTPRHILLSKIYMVQLNLLRSLNVSVTVKKRVGWGLHILKKNIKGP